MPSLRGSPTLHNISYFCYICSQSLIEMSTNKNAQLRYQVLDRCFSNFQRQYSFDDLVEAVNEKLLDLTGKKVSPRQIRDDIKFMRDSVGYAAPIEAYILDGKKCFYQYSDHDFRIFRKEISEEAMEAVRKTIGLLSQYRGLPTNGWMEEVISSIEVNLGMKPNVDNLVSLDRNSELLGLQFLSDVIDYTIAHQPLNITYRPFGRDARLITLHPYHVKQYNNRWFLWGWNEQRARIANLALDRIEKIQKSDVAFRPNVTVDFSTFFDDIIGVTVPGDNVPRQTFILQFSPDRLPYIMSKPMHPSQRVVSEPNCIISVTVKPNREFESLIFSYGADVKILSPTSFRDQFAQKINQIQKYYASVKNDSTDNN